MQGGLSVESVPAHSRLQSKRTHEAQANAGLARRSGNGNGNGNGIRVTPVRWVAKACLTIRREMFYSHSMIHESSKLLIYKKLSTVSTLFTVTFTVNLI